MQRILFVVNSYTTGGISSSLKSILYSNLKAKYEFKVFSIINAGPYKDIFSSFSIGLNFWTTLSFINRGYSEKGYLFLASIIRFLIFIARLLKFDLRSYICDRTISIIEKKNDFDYVVAFSEGFPTLFVSKFMNPNKIAWIHCDYSRVVNNIEEELRIYSIYRNVVLVSEYTQKSFCSLFPELTSKTRCVYNILDVNNIRSLSMQTLADISFDNSLFTIISVGRICDVKRYSYIPSIARELKNRNKLFVWYIIGPIADNDEYRTLQNNIHILDVTDCVKAIGTRINPYPYFLRSDLLVSVSSSEACPMIFNEAKVLKLPVVSADFGSASEFIKNGSDGFIKPLDQVADAIDLLMTDKDSYDRIKTGVNLSCVNKPYKQFTELFI